MAAPSTSLLTAVENEPDASVQAGHFDCYGSDTFGGEVIPAVSLMLMQDVPVIPIAYVTRPMLIQQNVKGWQVNLCTFLPCNTIYKAP